MFNKLFSRIWLALFGLAFLVSCTPEKSSQSVLLQGRTMGTTFNIKYFPTDSAPAQQQLLDEVNQSLVDLNQVVSTYIPDSELSLLNKRKANDAVSVSEQLGFMFDESIDINTMSDGAFDVTVGPLVNLWGFGPEGRITKKPSNELIAETKAWIGSNVYNKQANVVTKHHDNVYIDFSAIAKGYGVDVIADLLDSKGIVSYLVEIGGELKAKGVKPDGSNWTVAVEKPVTDQRMVQAIFPIDNVGMATSGDYRNYFEQDGIRFSHTIDGTSGSPITHTLASVTVLAATTARADAYATTINVMGPAKGLAFAEKHNIAAYMLVKSDSGFVEKSSSAFEPYLQKMKKPN